MTDMVKKTIAELRTALIEKREAIRIFRFGAAGSKAKNVKEGRGLRKDVARIMTELSRRRNNKE